MLHEAERLMQAGDWDGARKACRDVLRGHPTHAMAHAYEGMCFFRMGDFAQAEPCFRRAYTLDPKLTDAGIKQAQCLEKLRKYRDSMDIVKELLPRRPNDIALQSLHDYLKTQYSSEEHDIWEKSLRTNVHVIKSFGTETA